MDKLSIVFVVPGMAFQGDTIKTGSLGGSESACIYVARELAKLGHDVIVFSNCEKPGSYDKVTYGHISNAHKFMTTCPVDVTVVQRDHTFFGMTGDSKLNILWQHDLALGRTAPSFKSVLWNVDKVVTVSKFMSEQYKKVYGVDDSVLWTSRNGIDLDAFPKPNHRIYRQEGKMVYAARPERGLDVLLSMLPRIFKANPKATLHVCGYNNTAQHMQGFYNVIQNQMKQFGDRIKWEGHLNKRDLYKLFASASLYIYPTPSPMNPEFSEVSCISAMECQAAGLPFLSSNKGALNETVHPDAGVLIDGDPSSKEYQDKFVNAALSILAEKDRWTKMSEAGIENAKSLSWSSLAKEWSDEFVLLIKSRNSNPTGLVTHFIRRSDIVAADRVLSTLDATEEVTHLRKYLDDGWGNALMRETIEKHYEDMGKFTDERFSKLEVKEEHFDNTRERRFLLIEEYLKEHEDLKKILDFGCGHGWHDIYMERKVGREWLGIDIDPGAVKWSRIFADKFAKNPGNMKFRQGTHEISLKDEKGLFDCLIMSEVLEHCIDPESVINSMERWVKPGAPMILTVPYGPREYSEFETIKHRNHIHEIDLASIKEMLGKKPKFEVSAVYEDRIKSLNAPAGFYLIRYSADHEPVGKINWERKLSIQRPRQTVSATMIIGPGSEKTLGWCLDSMTHIADELVVGDCGMSEEAKDILKKWATGAKRVKIVDAPSPLIAGFDAARNVALKHCSGDWILWIDTDETITDPDKILKYLRENMFHGYSIRQHHFAVDTNFSPDLPVRLFRNRALNGNMPRFYGCVVPETKVTCNPDLKPIEDIKVNDFVRTHDGSYGKVSKLWQYDIDDKILDISAIGMPENLKVTKDHKLYAIRTDKCFYDKKRNVRCKSICKKQDHSCPHKFYEHYSPEMIPAGDVNIGDLLLYPIDVSVTDQESIKLSSHAKDGKLSSDGTGASYKLINGQWTCTIRRKRHTIKDELLVDHDLLRLCGYYISDGHITKRTKLSVAFGSHETKYIDDLVGILKKYGRNPIVKKDKKSKCINVAVNCRPLCEWLIGEFNSGSRNKHAPNWVMRLPVSKQESFLTGLWRGDGNVSGSLIRYTTVSTKLAYQVQELLLRMEIIANIRYGKASKAYEVFARIKRRKFLDWDMPSNNANVPQQAWTDGRYVYMRVKSIKSVAYKGKVHDITVEGNHSFVFNRVAGSNSIHEHAETELNKGVGPSIVISDANIAHVGYLAESGRRDRFGRNFPLLEMSNEKYPDRRLNKNFFIRDLMLINTYETEANGGQVTPEIKRRCEEVISLYREHFLGQPSYLGSDALSGYSNACRMLGIGFEASFALAASKDHTQNLPKVETYRFANEEDWMKELSYRGKMMAEPFESKYY